jgi:hypothetical protein
LGNAMRASYDAMVLNWIRSYGERSARIIQRHRVELDEDIRTDLNARCKSLTAKSSLSVAQATPGQTCGRLQA